MPGGVQTDVKTYQMLINGEWVASKSNRTFPVYDPSTEEIIAQVPEANADDVNRAVAAAKAAFEEGPWSTTTAQERGRVLFRLAEKVRQNLPALAEIECRNTGKPIVEAEYDITDAATCFEYYGGLATKRNILGIMIQSFVSLGWTTVLWIIFGYSLCFSGGQGGIIGNLDKAFLHGVTPASMFTNGKIPEYVFVAYQMMFAIITPALITGAFVNRVNFKAYFIFLTVWQILVYYPFVHMIWGGGLLAEWGVLDFAGGIVVHAIAGFAALASVFYVGARVDKNSTPNSIPLVAIGSGLLWFGWYGFNAGSELQVDKITAIAFLNDTSAGLLPSFSASAIKPGYIVWNS